VTGYEFETMTFGKAIPTLRIFGEARAKEFKPPFGNQLTFTEAITA
jgi:hypothetical protein